MSAASSASPARPLAAASIRPLALARWLVAVAVLVFVMVVVGGITRLTESGLSITEWKPVSGAIPPLSHADWQHQFDLYKQTTQYQTVNRAMTLGDFQFIFFWEYIHRLIGRLIGLAFAVPLLWFAWKRAIPRGYGWRLVALLGLGGLQGAIGWWMVTSGLVGRTEVSHFRLAVHLLLALFIIGGLVWTALDLRALDRDPGATPAKMPRFALAVLAVLVGQLLFGAFTAGLRAGLAASDWPLMNGRFFPSEVVAQGAVLHALVNDPYLVQFVHRWWAWVAAAMIVMLGLRVQRAGSMGLAHGMMTLLAVQIILGIATLLTGVSLWIAVAHQGVGALLVAAVTAGCHYLGRIPENKALA